MGARYKLSQAFIKSCSPGKYNDGAGLWLHKRVGAVANGFSAIRCSVKEKKQGLVD